MHDGRDDFYGGSSDASELIHTMQEPARETADASPRDPMRPTERQRVRERVRQNVRTLRRDSAEACGDLVVAPAKRECEEMQENARLSDAASERDRERVSAVDDGSPRGAAAAFEAQCKPLTARQQTAINLITMGKTIVAIARTLKVDPATIHRWKSSNPMFIAELNRRQAAMFDSTVMKLRLTMERAVEELYAIVTGPSKLARADATWKLLPMLRPAKLIVPSGPTTAAAVVDAQIRADRLARGEVSEGEITNEERLNYVRAEDRICEPAFDHVPDAAGTQSAAPA